MSNKKQRNEMEDEARQERILEQLKQSGRAPVPKPGYFHDTGEKQRRKRDRKKERTRLRGLARNHNNGFDDEEG